MIFVEWNSTYGMEFKLSNELAEFDISLNYF